MNIKLKIGGPKGFGVYLKFIGPSVFIVDSFMRFILLIERVKTLIVIKLNALLIVAEVIITHCMIFIFIMAIVSEVIENLLWIIIAACTS